jgi:hypothetical protein
MRHLRAVTAGWFALTALACAAYVADRLAQPSGAWAGDPLAGDAAFHVFASILLIALPSTFVLFPLLFFVALWRRRRHRRSLRHVRPPGPELGHI